MSSPYIVSGSASPYSAVVLIVATFPDGVRAQGSGAVVSGNTVLTASHVLYEVDHGGAATNVVVYVGNSRTTATQYVAATWVYNPINDAGGVLNEAGMYQDYGAVGLSVNIGNQTGIFGLTTTLTSGTVYNAGFPATYGGVMEADSGTAIRDSAGVVVTNNVYISPGSSGGPLWQVNNGQNQIVGIVSAGSGSTDYYAPINSTSLAAIQNDIAAFANLLSHELYTFMYSYGDGTNYYGYVVADASQALYVGFTKTITQLNGRTGTYAITGDLGSTQAGGGTVWTSTYYSPVSGSAYTPALYASGQAEGTSGLGSEADSVTLPSGQSLLFGPRYEAAITASTQYSFYYVFGDGADYYYGTVTANAGTYTAGQVLRNATADQSGGRGYYVITGTNGIVTQGIGLVDVSAYYLSVAGSYYTPYLHGAGQANGYAGLGSEFDFLAVTNGYTSYFGSPNGTASWSARSFSEAGLQQQSRPPMSYRFVYQYGDNRDYYYGNVSAAAGTYTVGQVIATALPDHSGSVGHYAILGIMGATATAVGSVSVSDYHSASRNAYYTPYQYAHGGGASGGAGLGSEFDFLNINGNYTSYFGNFNGLGSSTTRNYYSAS